jgi:HD-GYP domain-containing protein (c-di-GMP phosphodiesterase class II)
VLGALIHDIGKLEIPWEILNKKGKLTPEEWAAVRKHVNWGKEMAITSDKFKDLAPYIELHHERFDGTGYPHGYKGAEIPLLCRMLTIIDSFAAVRGPSSIPSLPDCSSDTLKKKALASWTQAEKSTQPWVNTMHKKAVP